MMRYSIFMLLIFMTTMAHAGTADVVDVKYHCAQTCVFHVTVLHADAGWDHYANRWEVLTPEGEIIATRILHHPHDHEQPFTRSLDGVVIPDGLSKVIVRAHDSVHGYGGEEIRVELSVASQDDAKPVNEAKLGAGVGSMK